jgi:phosphoribosylformylglycinamidine synthase subunit PurQ / glutaminase
MIPKVLVFSGYGLNSEEETKFAFETSGAKGAIVHINDLIDGHFSLQDFQILAFPGGFSYGDDTGSGNAYANKLRNHLWKELLAFIKRNTLIIGICNGFQILVNLGLVPALNGNYGNRQAALMNNESARLVTRWVDVKVENKSPWLKGQKELSMPIAHGEGKFFSDEKTLAILKKKNLIALRYIKGEMSTYLDLPANPNGALDDIAGITDETGRIFGLMPHPERAQCFVQLPNWPLLKQKYIKEGKKLPTDGPGLQIFRNAVLYYRSI